MLTEVALQHKVIPGISTIPACRSTSMSPYSACESRASVYR